MYPLIESLAIDNGQIQNLVWHEERYNLSYHKRYGHKSSFSLLEALNIILPESGLHKLRIAYTEKHKEFSIAPYNRQIIKSLKLVYDKHIEYYLKSSNRDQLNQLYNQKANCDDILIIKHNMVTDTFAGNIIFYNGKDWITPNTPLLKGTCRARLLSEGIIFEDQITIDDINKFHKFQIINALRDFNVDKASDISNILL